jgi:hypothetical protein
MKLEEIKPKWFWRGTLSRWLTAYFLGFVFAWMGLITFLERRSHGGTYADAYWAVGERTRIFGPTTPEILCLVLFWAGLLWFTFFSKSKRVTEDDKRFVRLWTTGAALLELVSLFRHISRAL